MDQGNAVDAVLAQRTRTHENRECGVGTVLARAISVSGRSGRASKLQTARGPLLKQAVIAPWIEFSSVNLRLGGWSVELLTALTIVQLFARDVKSDCVWTVCALVQSEAVTPLVDSSRVWLR